MEVKGFKQLSSLQKKEVYDFIKATDSTYNKSYVEMTKIYESDSFNDGETVFIAFHHGKINGSIALITKEICIKGEAFITDVYVELENAEILLKAFMEKIVEYCNLCNASSIKIGIREGEKHLITYINRLQFNHIYDAVIMKYSRDKNTILEVSKDIELVPLSIANSKQYMDIQNEAFKDSPNGGTIDEIEVKDYIVQYASCKELIGLCVYDGKPCGVYELSINGNVGWIDILAVSPKYQKKGIGKALMVKCIERLSKKPLTEIKLLVITSNDVAVRLYKENGFKDESIFSYWFEKSI